MKGMLNIYKPYGWTSSDVVCKVKKILNEHSVGHMGTLDPIAKGVLPIGVGKATRLFNYFLNKDKIYKAFFRFGYETDTLDNTGKVINENGRLPTVNEISDISKQFIGKINQIPPKYSAKKINGVKAYKLARQGREFDLPYNEVEIYSIKVDTFDMDCEMTIHCSAGTYIRSLGRDIAHALGTFATMTDLERIKAGEFTVEDSITLEELNEKKEKAIIPVEKVLCNVPKYEVPQQYYNKLSNGIKLNVTPFYVTSAVYCCDELFGLGKAPNGELRIETYLRD